ncbi:MAG: GH1 family beta-glucosidase [Fimbriimonadaceae bacterium]
MSLLRFPDEFVWGSATASYQIEGAARDEGRGPSVWDTFSHTPNKVANGQTGDIACDHYRRYREDVGLMSEIGLQAYRFSISWSRLLPHGTGPVNQAGLDFYNRLLDELASKAIDPYITLFHWDYPQELHDRGGWAHPDAAQWFGDFAELCFSQFGDRCKHWITLNEPWCYAFLGHGVGVHAPGIVSDLEPFRVGHGLLLGHGEAISRFRALVPDGEIGLTTNHVFVEPISDSAEDRQAVLQHNAWSVGWFLDPIYRGDYPAFMKDRYPMPEFTPETSALVSAPTDFMGLNFYMASPVRWNPKARNDAEEIDDPTMPHTAMGWIVSPDGIRHTLVESQRIYNPPKLLVTENGCAFEDAVVDGQVRDIARVQYLRSYLSACHSAIEEGANLAGYFVWSFLDNFEWAEGYRPRFGITYVDFETQARILKSSAYMFRSVIKSNGLTPEVAC